MNTISLILIILIIHSIILIASTAILIMHIRENKMFLIDMSETRKDLVELNLSHTIKKTEFDLLKERVDRISSKITSIKHDFDLHKSFDHSKN